jgi:acyl-CoA thioesterase-1
MSSLAPGRRRVAYVVTVLVAAAMAALAWQRLGPYPITNMPPRGSVLVAFGDSLTAGTGASPGNDYPSQLGRRLNTLVVNCGVGGDTSARALARLDKEVLPLNPDIVIVILGGNDLLHGVPQREAERNLSTIIERLQACGAVVVLGEIRGVPLAGDYGSMYRRLARRYGTALVPDLLGGILTNPALKSDPIHPNDEGYRMMTDRVAAVVKPLLAQAGQPPDAAGSAGAKAE